MRASGPCEVFCPNVNTYYIRALCVCVCMNTYMCNMPNAVLYIYMHLYLTYICLCACMFYAYRHTYISVHSTSYIYIYVNQCKGSTSTLQLPRTTGKYLAFIQITDLVMASRMP
jgi:hypothetical protein